MLYDSYLFKGSSYLISVTGRERAANTPPQGRFPLMTNYLKTGILRPLSSHYHQEPELSFLICIDNDWNPRKLPYSEHWSWRMNPGIFCMLCHRAIAFSQSTEAISWGRENYVKSEILKKSPPMPFTRLRRQAAFQFETWLASSATGVAIVGTSRKPVHIVVPCTVFLDCIHHWQKLRILKCYIASCGLVDRESWVQMLT